MRLAHMMATVAAVAAIAAQPATAQGYLSVNGRNHPEIEWLVAETEHFKIVYPRRISGVEVEAANVAEETYDVLSQNLEVSFDQKIRVYLSDEDEIVNGFAVPLGAGHTNIWVHLNDAADVWTGREKWIRKVVSHELAHIFHYRAIRSRIRPFDLYHALPRFWTEGLAQYETEDWDAYRGERWLRTAVLDDRLSYTDGRSIWNGRLLYSVGNAQVRYFTSEFGDSTLVELLQHRRTVFPGIRIHDFDRAFADVTGKSYREFYDDWRRHINIQYNTIAGQMESEDSLGVAPEAIPGQYIRDIGFSADGTVQVALVLRSVDHPVTQLVVRRSWADAWRVLVDGDVRGPIAVAPAGDRVAYTRLVRGADGSLLNDLFEVSIESGRRKRLTKSRRAAYPSYSPDGNRLAFVGSSRGTGNVFVLDIASGVETRITNFSGDEQLAHTRWHPSKEVIAYSRFGASGIRAIETIHADGKNRMPVTSGVHDDRQPIWSPDGNSLAYTSLRDGVPNAFIASMSDQTPRRVTAIATGADAFAWKPGSRTSPAGSLAVRIAASKSRDRVFVFGADRRVGDPDISLPAGYTKWTTHRPPSTIPAEVPFRRNVVQSRESYRPLSNLTHVASLALPYYISRSDFGAVGFTVWTEPLGKHTVALLTAVSAPDPVRSSSFQIGYLNNQFRPQIEVLIERFPEYARPYGNGILREKTLRLNLNTRWPLQLTTAPFVRSSISLRARYVDVTPLNADAFDDELVPIPEAGHQADLRVSLTVKRQEPYRYNVVHPLDGVGIRVRAMGALRSVSQRTGFLRLGASAYGIVPGFDKDRLFGYVRVQYQRGETLAQNFLGLSRYDELQPDTPDLPRLWSSDVERVRGYRQFAVGRSVWFGSVEYRVPITTSLETRILGLVSLGATSVSLFADGALVYADYSLHHGDRRLGVGVEVKNAVTLHGLVTIMHSLGVAQRSEWIGSTEHELYYRIRAAVPF